MAVTAMAFALDGRVLAVGGKSQYRQQVPRRKLGRWGDNAKPTGASFEAIIHTWSRTQPSEVLAGLLGVVLGLCSVPGSFKDS